MFKKPHDVGLSKKHALGGKDVKKFHNDVLKKYPALSDDVWRELFPEKVVWFLKLNSGTLVWKNAEDNPIFFDPSGHLDVLVPTLYALSILPEMVPSVRTNSFVSETMLRGADLFLQGMTGEDFLKDQIRSVMIPGNPIPFAVGKMALSYTQALASNMEGRGLINLHHFGDQLYGIGNGKVPNQGFSSLRVVACQSMEDTDNDKDGVDVSFENMISKIRVEDEKLGEEDMVKLPEDGDDVTAVIWSCALGALQSVKKTEMPISLNEFYSTKMMPLKPGDLVSLDMKKSKWKRVPKLLEDMEGQGLLVLKTVRKEVCICDIDKSHCAIRDWKPERTETKDKPRDSCRDSGKIQEIQYLYKSPQIFSDLLGLDNYRNQLVGSDHIDARLREYIEGYGGMQQGTVVSVDPLLASSLFGKKEQPGPHDTVSFQDIQKRMYEKLQKWHCVEKIGNDGTVQQIINKGEPSNICITALKRSGRVYTVITGMENFGYNPRTLSDTLQKRMKTACFVADLPGKNNKKEVVMQGDWISKRAGSHYLPGYFKEEGIPTSCITTLNKMKKK